LRRFVRGMRRLSPGRTLRPIHEVCHAPRPTYTHGGRSGSAPDSRGDGYRGRAGTARAVRADSSDARRGAWRRSVAAFPFTTSHRRWVLSCRAPTEVAREIVLTGHRNLRFLRP